jgi:FkbM family methyltransferase
VKTAKRFVQSALNKFGYRLIRNDSRPTYGLDAFFPLLLQLGFIPKHIVDVGANHGLWTRQAFKFFPNARFTLVEPQDHLKVHVQDLIRQGCNIRWINAGVADKPGKLPFTILHRDDSSTFTITAREAQGAGVQQVFVEVKTLNEIASSNDAPPDMVKIDAEGYDLKVLSGASELFGKTEIFLVEAVMGPCQHENTMLAVIQKMAAAGYQLFDITDLNRSPKSGVLWLCEIAFLRNNSRLSDDATLYE